MKIYLAARYGRRLELCGYRDALVAMGHAVTSRWLDGAHQAGDHGQPPGPEKELLVGGDSGGDSPEAAGLRAKFALEDYQDVVSSDLLIAFTEPPRSSAGRGGRHVELGIALGRLIPVYVVGHRENVFCWLQGLEFFEDFEAARRHLGHSHPWKRDFDVRR